MGLLKPRETTEILSENPEFNEILGGAPSLPFYHPPLRPVVSWVRAAPSLRPAALGAILYSVSLLGLLLCESPVGHKEKALFGLSRITFFLQPAPSLPLLSRLLTFLRIHTAPACAPVDSPAGPRRTWQMLGLWAEESPGQSWGTEVITISEGLRSHHH